MYEHSAVLEPPVRETAPIPRSPERLLSLEIPVTVSFGEREMPMRELAALGPDAVLELDRPANGAVDLLVNGRSVARGELVVVSGQFALKVTEIVSTGERIRSLRPEDGGY